ncbi:hypothetical protein DV515_00001683 [Chloebia gouldiae]|uniref:MARVEL domain-containing protein n=1 Tax=Chloebia gouldiae TaxID=44316 RepID=A0A3L8SY59_CHLGU|nr:hypothetical protein DV515_00001683 [Chloebia gouldiae]
MAHRAAVQRLIRSVVPFCCADPSSTIVNTLNVLFVFQISLLIGFISVNNSQWTDYSAYSFFQIVTMCDLVMILFFYIMHIFRVYRKLTCVSWPLAEFLHYLIGTILLLIGSIVAASKSYNITGLVAGATFGFLATILCVISMWSSYKVSCITQSTMFNFCPLPSDDAFCV